MSQIFSFFGSNMPREKQFHCLGLICTNYIPLQQLKNNALLMLMRSLICCFVTFTPRKLVIIWTFLWEVYTNSRVFIISGQCTDIFLFGVAEALPFRLRSDCSKWVEQICRYLKKLEKYNDVDLKINLILIFTVYSRRGNKLKISNVIKQVC